MNALKKILVLLLISLLLCTSLLAVACENIPAPQSEPQDETQETPPTEEELAPSTPKTYTHDENSDDPAEVLAAWKEKYTAGNFTIRDESHPFVELTLSTGDKIRLELYPDFAPITVENFVKYVKDGFYEGVVFHRIIQNFMIQTGGFALQDGKAVYKTPTYPNIKGEFLNNGVENYINHIAGVISMARSNDMDSGSSQFFICSAYSPRLNGNYAAFGRVIDEESMAVVSKLEKTETTTKTLYYGSYPASADDVPVTFPVITKTRLVQVTK